MSNRISEEARLTVGTTAEWEAECRMADFYEGVSRPVPPGYSPLDRPRVRWIMRPGFARNAPLVIVLAMIVVVGTLLVAALAGWI